MRTLLAQLAARPSTSLVHNFYDDVRRLRNLELYFDFLARNQPRLMVIGEAPGYRGCATTGIPFTSTEVLRSSDQEFFRTARQDLFIPEDGREATATQIWRALSSTPTPALWNAFPFHPHTRDDRKTNRAPTRTEIAEGLGYLKQLLDHIRPTHLVAVGKAAQNALLKLDYKGRIFEVRHPSYGGATIFASQMSLILNDGSFHDH